MHSYLQSAYYSIEPENDKGESIDTLELDAAVFRAWVIKVTRSVALSLVI